MADVVASQYTPIFLFLAPRNPTIVASVSAVASPGTPVIYLRLESPSIYNETHVAIPIDAALRLSFQAFAAGVSVFVPDEISVPRRFRRSAWQARLGNKLDPIKRKFLDNSILLAAHPTDMLRIRVTRDPRSHDIRSRKIVANEILPIMLPVLENVPMRRLVRDDYNVLSLSVTDIENSKPFEVYCPGIGQLQRDDLLFRFIGDAYSELPYVMVLQVKDELGTIGYSSILHVKYSVTLYDEPLPSAVVSAVYAAAIKRGRLKW